jgi:hypothetical protein
LHAGDIGPVAGPERFRSGFCRSLKNLHPQTSPKDSVYAAASIFPTPQKRYPRVSIGTRNRAIGPVARAVWKVFQQRAKRRQS